MKKIFTTLVLILIFLQVKSQCTNTGIALAATSVVNNINCSINDGSITINASGGFTDLSSPNGTGYTFSITSGPITRPAQSSNVFLALYAGNYTLNIRDCNGNNLSISAIITGVYNSIASNPVSLPSICLNKNRLKTGPSGGKSPYNITLNTYPIGSSPVIKGDTITGLTAGSVTYTITDACGNNYGVTATVNTLAPVNVTRSDCYWAGCSNSKFYFNNLNGAGIDYRQAFNVSVPNYDTIFYDLYFNGSLTQSLSFIGNSNSLYSPHVFNSSSFGKYEIITRTSCGQINKDSFYLTNLSGTGSSRLSTRNLSCMSFDANMNYFSASIANNMKNGNTFSFLAYPATFTILSGPSRVGFSKTQQMFGTNGGPSVGTVDTLMNLSFGTYTIEFKDSCGNKDTVTYTQNAAVGSASPNVSGCGVVQCNLNKDNYYQVYLHYLFPNTPKTTPVKYEFISGPSNLWSNYPFQVIDSAYFNNGQFCTVPLLTGGTYQIAVENGCGFKDTILYSITCPTTSHNYISSTSVTPKCGNIGDITINLGLGSGPCGFYGQPQLLTTIPTLVSGSSTTSNVYGPSAINTWSNQPAGTYKFYFSNNFGYNPSSGRVQKYLSIAGDWTGGTQINTPVNKSDNRTKIGFVSSSFDTSKLRVWDTVFSVVIPNSNINISPTTAYICDDGSSNGAIKISPNTSMQPLTYRYSLISNTGPWSASQSDSLINLTSAVVNNTVYIQVTDGCGTSTVVNSTIQNLTTNTSPSCSGSGMAEFNPNPSTRNFSYDLRNLTTPTYYSYNYPTNPSIDMTNPANAGTYSIGYRLIAGSSKSCVLDSTQFILSSPCMIALPMKWLKFDIKKDDKSVNLFWSENSGENKILYYIVERKLLEDIDFKAIGKVYTRQDVSKTNYVYNDKINIDIPFHDYRIVAIDENGNSHYSEIKRIYNYINSNIYKIYINNFDELEVYNSNFMDENGNIQIFDMNGKKVFNSLLQIGNNVFNIENMINGVYFVYIVNNNGFYSQKILICK